MKTKDIFIWLILFIVGSLIVSAIIYPETFYNLRSNIDKISENSESKIVKYSTLNVVENPEDYVGINLSLKNIYICYGDKIVSYREDGTPINLPYKYERSLNAYYKFDFYGTIESNSPKNGIISVDDNGNPINIKYWFRVDRAVKKDRIDVTLHPYFGSCKQPNLS